MQQMIMLILDDVDHTEAVLDAWEDLGVSGITILESTGLGRVRRMMGARDDVSIMPTLRSLLHSREERHRTLITVVDDEALVDRLIAAVVNITGSLSDPHRGVIFVLPVVRAVGLANSADSSPGHAS